MQNNARWRALLGLAIVVAANAEDGPLPIAASLDLKPLEGLEHAIGEGKYPKTTSILIMRNGRLAYERYFGEGSEVLLNNTRTATKFLTTLALGAAIDDGAIPSEHSLAFAYFEGLEAISK